MASSSSSLLVNNKFKAPVKFYSHWTDDEIRRFLPPNILRFYRPLWYRDEHFTRLFASGEKQIYMWRSLPMRFAEGLRHPNTKSQLDEAKRIQRSMDRAYASNKEVIKEYDEQSGLYYTAINAVRKDEENLNRMRADTTEHSSIRTHFISQAEHAIPRNQKAAAEAKTLMDTMYRDMESKLPAEFKARDALRAVIATEPFDRFDQISYYGVTFGMAIEQQDAKNRREAHLRYGSSESKDDLDLNDDDF